MSDVKVRTANVEIRTVKLTKALLKQFRRLTSVPEAFQVRGDDGQLRVNPENVVGWFHGSVLGEEFMEYTLFTNNKGDYFVYHYVPDGVKKCAKQIYIP